MLFRSLKRCWFPAFLLLQSTVINAAAEAPAGKEQDPPRDYLILINYELGMHCTGFPPFLPVFTTWARMEL